MISKLKKQRKKKNKEEVIFQVVFFGLIFLFFAFLALSNYRISKRRAELTEKIESLRQEIETMEQERGQLEEGISQTQEEIYWEGKIREQGYVREGENQVIVLGENEPEGQEGAGEQFFLAKLFGSIKDFFIGIIQR